MTPCALSLMEMTVDAAAASLGGADDGAYRRRRGLAR
jgi:hypothetical protein